jgi:hypothetical protein
MQINSVIIEEIKCLGGGNNGRNNGKILFAKVTG